MCLRNFSANLIKKEKVLKKRKIKRKFKILLNLKQIETGGYMTFDFLGIPVS